MAEIIKDGQVVTDEWTLVREGDATGEHLIVSLVVWQADSTLQERADVGVWLASDEQPDPLFGALDTLPLIACDFPTHMDGRGFSYGRELRERGFNGELRAVGGFMRDQLDYMRRCGFNSFALEHGDLNDALSSLTDFADNYQSKALYLRA